jgi:hypothetical protein
MIWTVVGTLGIIAAAIAAGVALDRKIGILPRPRELREAGRPGWRLPVHAPGAAPETALAAPADHVRCRACGRQALPDSEDRATYGDRELVVRRYRCRRCAAITASYSAT